MELLKVDTVEEARAKMDVFFQDVVLAYEKIAVEEGLGRVLYEDVYAPVDLPEFHRSTVDGYAVAAKDTFGAGEGLPAFLQVIGRVEMGEGTNLKIRSGEAVYVPTGGMIPEGADGVVMVEYAESLDEGTIAVYQSVAPGEGMILKGEDIRAGELLFSKGRRLKSQDIGALAALGIRYVKVFEKPKISIISTGDEIVDPFSYIKFGQIRDINTYALWAMAKELGAIVTYRAVIKDDDELLRRAAVEALENSHILVISGGSSVGAKDATARVIHSLGEPGVFVHGVAMKPGKPTIIGKAKNKAVFGLPGHPVSAIIVFQIFTAYLLEKMQSLDGQKKLEIYAKADANIHASPGKETYQMVVVEEVHGEYLARPVHGKSGAITLLTKSHGYIRIETNKEGIQKGEKVKVILF
ncbi:molybdopterin molybdotransferase MoeA [Thermotalea metallivorans]|uniref:Molybdopterin molybdenumtransferase n=1 Tax=Thermotalea metallivorans TaxID=520762 RepID=A0A140LAK6_9FIRM|nr:gephyrin-like molybdotransferase Glp [Thermotalea metallivorans]KXG77581.1 Molybdopterin molybdenumtransferase [Thermotalea metallivorans]